MTGGSARLNWAKLLSPARLPNEGGSVEQVKETIPGWLISSRSETERDFDRILFSTPTRRLGDKTQVFPLEKNESIRNRLTHSHEVANLARSIGTHLINSELGERIIAEAIEGDPQWNASLVRRAVPAILAAAGLAHDLGNPPFGHQGEEAIRSWVRDHEEMLFRDFNGQELEGLTPALKDDFLKFEGNAQTLRTLARLQVVKDHRGLNLTFATLAAVMKYTVPADGVQSKVDGKNPPAATKKVGFFASEVELVQRVRMETGLGSGHIRHPLTYIMEACDDIAYLIVDAEDAVKKQIVSFHDMMAWLECLDSLKHDEVSQWILATARTGASQARMSKLPPSEINDVAMQIFRANAITAMVSAVIAAFQVHYDAIMTTGLDQPLIDVSASKAFADAMKEFDKQHVYRHRGVLEVELDGHNTIHKLLDMLWRGITEREVHDKLESPRTTPFARYAYGRISENYRRVFEGSVPTIPPPSSPLPIRYKELQLLTDMVSGMTDQYAVDLQRELQAFNVGSSAIRR